MSSELLQDVARRGSVLAVVAHPDDESFGLGALLAALARHGASVRVVCFTRGEASTLGARGERALGKVRGRELADAAARLGVRDVTLHDFPDGGLADAAPDALDGVVTASVGEAATLVVFEPGGVTGHPDHRAATASALRVARRRRLGVLEWGVSGAVAAVLNAELGTSFVPLDGAGTVDVDVRADRDVQLGAIACHASQAATNPVLDRRLELEGAFERVRFQAPSTAR